MEELGLVLGIIFIPVGILIAVCCIGVAAQHKKINNTPSTKRAATIVSKRTVGSGYGYDTKIHYILFQLEDGGRVEYPVNSTWFNQLIVGDTGILVNRGKYFHEFLRQ